MPEPVFDDLVALAASLCRTPVAWLAFFDQKEHLLKARVGISDWDLAPDLPLCPPDASLSELWVVTDTTQNPWFARHPWVSGGPRLRFIAGTPLASPDATAIGMLCIGDVVAKQITPDEKRLLLVIGQQVMSQLELRRRTTELAFAERALHESEEQLRLALDTAQTGIFDWDLCAHRLTWSPSHEKLWGFAPGEFDGTSLAFMQRLHPDDLPSVRAEMARCIEKRQPLACEFRVVWPDKSLHWVACTGRYEFGPSGEAFRMRGAVREITERKQAEQILHESETRYRFLFEHNPMPMLIYELGTLSMLAVNEAFIQHYGYSREEALALRLTDLYPEEEKAKIARLITKLRGHANVGEWHHRKRDGTYISIIARSDDLTYMGRTARVAVMTDITEHKRRKDELQAARESLEERVRMRTAELAVAKESAESADRLKSAFLATMSHELRTPLNSIIGFTGIVLQGLAGPLSAEQTKQLGIVQGSARHLLALINDVLDISKIEAGQLELHNAPFDLRSMLDKVLALIRPMAEKKGLDLKMTDIAEDLTITSDRLRIEQVLLNLLNNAVKFTEKGYVRVSAEVVAQFKFSKLAEPSNAVRVHVEDTGIGIKPENMEQMFLPFRQIDSGLARQHEGTGLGLAICRRLAELLGGEISASSEWGRGSTFTFVMPVNRHMG